MLVLSQVLQKALNGGFSPLRPGVSLEFLLPNQGFPLVPTLSSATSDPTVL